MYRSLTFYTSKKVVKVLGYPSLTDSKVDEVRTRTHVLCMLTHFTVTIQYFLNVVNIVILPSAR